MNELTISPVEPQYNPSTEQKLYAALLLEAECPQAIEDIAGRVGVDPVSIHRWHASPSFRSWLAWDIERRAEMQVPAVWRELLRLALGESDSRVKLEAARLYLARFDKQARALAIGTAKAAESFGKEMARVVAKVRA